MAGGAGPGRQAAGDAVGGLAVAAGPDCEKADVRRKLRRLMTGDSKNYSAYPE
jgi:hypothetical protein